MTTSRTLTISTFAALGACGPQRTKFQKLFGDSVEITEALCVAHAATFNFDWAASHLLSASARAEYDRVEAAAWAEYDRVEAAARAEYDRVTAPARAEYERVEAAARAEYERVTAAAFARAYNNE